MERCATPAIFLSTCPAVVLFMGHDALIGHSPFDFPGALLCGKFSGAGVCFNVASVQKNVIYEVFK